MKRDPKRYDSDPTYPASGKHPLRTIPAKVIAEKLRRSSFPPPEIARTLEENISGPQEAVETMQPCPCCAACGVCRGLGAVTATVAASYIANSREIQAALDNDEEE